MAPKSNMTNVFIGGEKETRAVHREKQSLRVRDWSDASDSTSQEIPKIADNHQKVGRGLQSNEEMTFMLF